MMGCDSDSDDEMKGKGKKAKRMVSESDGRRKRAEVVRRVMAEKGMKMIEASKYVKEHGLYKK
jgi:coproporphyrinogen III oxidase-like Fe-S oxidoreductase